MDSSRSLAQSVFGNMRGSERADRSGSGTRSRLRDRVDLAKTRSRAKEERLADGEDESRDQRQASGKKQDRDGAQRSSKRKEAR